LFIGLNYDYLKNSKLPKLDRKWRNPEVIDAVKNYQARFGGANEIIELEDKIENSNETKIIQTPVVLDYTEDEDKLLKEKERGILSSATATVEGKVGFGSFF
jgi:hypothetical protein